jgi:hypothetical protein
MDNNCTCRSIDNICSSRGGVQEKGKRGSKHDKIQFGRKNGAFMNFTPC